MKKTSIILIVVSLFGTGIYWGSPFFTLYQMKNAAVARDAEALSDFIDFESLRQNIKEQLNASIAKEMLKQQQDNNPFASLGVAFGSMLINNVVENYITPSAIILMLEGSKPTLTSEEVSIQPTNSEILENVSFHYKSLNKFIVTIKESDINFIMKRNNLFSWKVVGIIIPLD